MQKGLLRLMLRLLHGSYSTVQYVLASYRACTLPFMHAFMRYLARSIPSPHLKPRSKILNSARTARRQ
jgi:hypothetical protein